MYRLEITVPVVWAVSTKLSNYQTPPLLAFVEHTSGGGSGRDGCGKQRHLHPRTLQGEVRREMTSGCQYSLFIFVVCVLVVVD